MSERVLVRVTTIARDVLASLDAAEDDAWVEVPGFHGRYRAKHIKRGLETHALKVHWSGRGLCWATEPYTPSWGKREAVRLTPGALALERLIAADDAFPPAKPEAVKALLAQFKRIDLGLGPRKAEPEPVASGLEWEL